MNAVLQITTVELTPGADEGYSFDMNGRCAFLICVGGAFDVTILNEAYHVRQGSVIACMPYVDIAVTGLREPSGVIMGELKLERVPEIIPRWNNTSGLIAIQNHPVVDIPPYRYRRILDYIDFYLEDCADHPGDDDADRIMSEVALLQSRVIVGHVISTFFDNLSHEVKGNTHGDEIFQRFMLLLFRSYMDHREVSFYALHSGVSLKYFSTMIMKASGATPSQWIEKVVVGRAKAMLGDSNYSVKDVAAWLNFPDAPTFTKYFARVAGMTPKAYRKTIDRR